MAVAIVATAIAPESSPRPRRLRPLTRHTSMPMSSISSLDALHLSDSGHKNKAYLRSPSHLSAISRSKHWVQSESNQTSSLITQLRRDRDSWRSLARNQERSLIAAQHDLTEQAQAMSAIEANNNRLRHAHAEGVTATRYLYSRLQSLIADNNKLLDQLDDTMRTVAKLNKSDRAKGKVLQRNLRLKAALQHLSLHSASSSSQSDTSVDSNLREALAIATQRIEELESKGVALTEALEKQDDSHGDEDEEYNGGKSEIAKANLMEAEVIFRGVLDDETFQDHKLNWACLLDD